jgi:hypothetical protein
LSLIDHPVDVVGLGDIGSNGNGLPPCGVRGRDHLLRFSGAGPVIDDNPKSLPRKKQSSCRTDPTASTRDHRHA